MTKLRNLALLKKNIGRVIKTAFFESWERSWWQIILFNVYSILFFRNSSKQDFDNITKFRHGCQNCIPRVPGNILKAIRFKKTVTFFSISLALWLDKSSQFSDFFSAGLPKMQFSCPVNTPRKDNSAETGTILTFYWILNRRKFEFSRKLAQECLNCIFVSRGAFGRKQFYWSFFKFYEHFQQKKSNFGRKIVAEL